MAARPFRPLHGPAAHAFSGGDLESLHVPLGRVLVNVGLLLNDTRGFPPRAMELLDAIHDEAVVLYETVCRLTYGEAQGEGEVQ